MVQWPLIMVGASEFLTYDLNLASYVRSALYKLY
jgi:hypothetical protein